MALIFAVSSISQPPGIPEGFDKDLHAVLYAGLGVLLVRAFTRRWQRRATVSIAAAAIVVAVFYGVTDEYHQSFVPMRQADAMDVVADAIGATVAAFALYLWDIIRSRHGV